MLPETCKLLVVGSGPHALSVVTRLLEPFPASTVDEEQHHRMIHWRKTHQHNHSRTSQGLSHEDIVVVDPSGCWMSRWSQQFEAFHIEHLRSPSFFHPDPSDVDALRAFAEKNNRTHEFTVADDLFDQALKSPVDKKKQYSKGATRQIFNATDRLKYGIPSSKLFQDFCRNLVERYRLQGVVRKGCVRSIEPLSPQGQTGFRVTVEQGSIVSVVHCQNVVVSIGTGNIPRYPEWTKEYHVHASKNEDPNRMLHSHEIMGCSRKEVWQRLQSFASKQVSRSGSARLLIVGGGLTSAHLAILACRLGFTEVSLMTRSYFRTKYFDASLPWVGRYKNVHFSEFYGTQDWSKRLEIIRSAREGGSITPAVMRTLREQNRICLLQQTVVKRCRWSGDHWCIQMEQNHRKSATTTMSEMCVNQIWLATGWYVHGQRSFADADSLVDVNQEPLLQGMQKACPIQVVGGYPVLTEDLSWCKGCYVMGGYAALQLGPNALNLNGARAGAQRISECLLQEMKQQRQTVPEQDSEHESEEEQVELVFGKAGNYFELLAEC